MKINILKCHGSGNDFILIDEYHKILFSEEQRKTLSNQLCDRNGILGADGILFFQNSDKADGTMRMFNPDGSEAEMCGNGLRCVGRFACESLDKHSVSIETLKGVSQVEKDQNIHPDVATYKAELSTISLNTDCINQILPALSPVFKFTEVHMPNPHIVAIVDNISDTELDTIGAKANQLPELFPNGTNINFCQILDDGAIFVRTYERGVGLTNSCGSGMSASTLVYCLLKHSPFGNTIDVYNRGGLVRCQATNEDGYSVYLSGNATFMFKSSISLSEDITHYFGEIFVDELQNYGKLLEMSKMSKPL
ncbi:diaminopimelate epimerase [Candidatus Marithrix sp. Canyon 246]|uniref:diaminopimelate epimerase n=1 Tax=Candidatus Marithrix sp. Canyon 246 TaxID=1827136 RepID=UPI00084A167D|nr:diaminopimelate epimerase [Candidatus Marithrix sp. Canyon 246]